MITLYKRKFNFFVSLSRNAIFDHIGLRYIDTPLHLLLRAKEKWAFRRKHGGKVQLSQRSSVFGNRRISSGFTTRKPMWNSCVRLKTLQSEHCERSIIIMSISYG